MKVFFSSFFLISSLGFAASTNKCRLYVEIPRIYYITSSGHVGTNTNPQPVNNGVLTVLKTRGFEMANQRDAEFSMDTEVRCGSKWTWLGYQDFCQAQVEFKNKLTGQVVYKNGPTPALIPGLNIPFDQIVWPRCADLK